MQLLLDGERPTLVTMVRNEATGLRIIEFHTPNETGSTSINAAVILGEQVMPHDVQAIGQLVLGILS